MARLRYTEKADKEIDKLDRPVKGAMWDFMKKFRQDPSSPGLRFKQLKGDSRLYSARVSDDYRALLVHVHDDEYVLVAVRPRADVYENLDRYSCQVNEITGGIEFYDLPSIIGTVQPAPAPAGLFAQVPDAQLIELGVGRPLLSTIGKITTEAQLLEFADCVPQLTADVLLALYTGTSVDEVLEQITTPVSAGEPVDTADFAAAVERPASLVTTDDETLRAILQGGFERWQVYLHPAQRRIVDRTYSGPARVSGGPGTGKTIVALHRVKWLVRRLPAIGSSGPASSGKDVLLTTFNKNLAADLRQRLLLLGGQELLDRVDVVNVDRLAHQVVQEAQAGVRLHWMDSSKALELWQAVLLEVGETRWDAGFLNDEWSQVVLGHAITSRQEYFRTRRAGRGRQLNRGQRAEIWELVEQFTRRLDEQGLWTSSRIAAHAARLEQQLAVTRAPRYRHIVVDEAQDLSSAHWMLRSMVAKAPNDLFLVGDTHQRIYENYVSLSSLGIEIRGRSSRLTLTYRSTREILTAASRILGDGSWDDLDDGTDSLTGYRSVLRGPRPEFRPYPSWPDELDGILGQVRDWFTGASVAVAVPTNKQAEEVASYLTAHGVPAGSIGPDGPRLPEGVHVGTLQRFKGLEYQRMILAGITDAAIPGHRAADDPVRQQRDLMRSRSLLFVAATRARDALIISWHGIPSRFLPAQS
jgi:superfamily I DNA/RNA helicase/mRNA-degrading endonuclease RelE of RelBE toxin-antitoxin system